MGHVNVHVRLHGDIEVDATALGNFFVSQQCAAYAKRIRELKQEQMQKGKPPATCFQVTLQVLGAMERDGKTLLHLSNPRVPGLLLSRLFFSFVWSCRTLKILGTYDISNHAHTLRSFTHTVVSMGSGIRSACSGVCYGHAASHRVTPRNSRKSSLDKDSTWKYHFLRWE